MITLAVYLLRVLEVKGWKLFFVPCIAFAFKIRMAESLMWTNGVVFGSQLMTQAPYLWKSVQASASKENKDNLVCSVPAATLTGVFCAIYFDAIPSVVYGCAICLASIFIFLLELIELRNDVVKDK
jgi:hypothetical protein